MNRPPGVDPDWLRCVYCNGWGPPKRFHLDFGTTVKGERWDLGICHYCHLDRQNAGRRRATPAPSQEQAQT